MPVLSRSDYAYFYEDGAKMYHAVTGEVELTEKFNWEDEAIDMLRDAGCSVGMLEPYAGVIVTDGGDVIDAQYRMMAISMDA